MAPRGQAFVVAKGIPNQPGILTGRLPRACEEGETMRALSAIAMCVMLSVLVGCGKRPDPKPPLPPEDLTKKVAPKPVEVAKKELPKPEPEKQPAPPPRKDLAAAVRRRVDAAELQFVMKQIGIAYLNYSATAGKRTPKDREELASFYENSARVNKLIAEKDIEVAFGTIPPSADDRSKTPLAWETSLDFAGRRIVVMFDGAVSEVPDVEFQQLPKAKARK